MKLWSNEPVKFLLSLILLIWGCPLLYEQSYEVIHRYVGTYLILIVSIIVFYSIRLTSFISCSSVAFRRSRMQPSPPKSSPRTLAVMTKPAPHCLPSSVYRVARTWHARLATLAMRTRTRCAIWRIWPILPRGGNRPLCWTKCSGPPRSISRSALVSEPSCILSLSLFV